jgi:two-component system, cell cycle response regulator DivK
MTSPLILVVDPDLDTRIILRMYFEHRHYRVLDCADGAAGLALARQHKPDLVIGDLPMDVPGHSHFADALRSDAGSNAPLLVYTASVLPEDTELARGADTVVFKPASPTEVLIEVERLLDRRGETPALAR